MPLSPTSPLAPLLLGASLVLSAGCRRAPSSDEGRQDTSLLAAPTASPAPTALREVASGTQARTLFEAPESAYHTTLELDGDALVLLTTTHLIRLTEGRPPARWPLPLEGRAAFFGDSVVYWNAGAVWAVAKTGGEPKRLGTLADPPQLFLGSERGFVWLERTASGGSVLRHFRGDVPHTLYETQKQAVAPTMREDRIYFVENDPAQGWRLTGVSLDGKKLPPTTVRSGRTPSMLAAVSSGVYYYDGPSSSVRRLGLGLGEETTLAERVICSPLVVSIGVFCAQVGGLYEIPLDGRPTRPLVQEAGGPVTALTADEERLVWVVDVAAEKLAVRSLRLR